MTARYALRVTELESLEDAADLEHEATARMLAAGVPPAEMLVVEVNSIRAELRVLARAVSAIALLAMREHDEPS